MGSSEIDTTYTIESATKKIILDKHTLSVHVVDGEAIWRTVAGSPSIRLNLENCNIPLQAAQDKQFIPYQSGYFEGLQIKLSNFVTVGAEYDIEMIVNITLNLHSEEVGFEVNEVRVKAPHTIQSICWPGSFQFNSESQADYTVVPAMQGYLIPSNWTKPIIRYHEGQMFSRDAYMPWWGQYKDGYGYIAIMDTPVDACVSVEHIPNLHTSVEVIWQHSFEELGYVRKLRFMFSRYMGYVGMAQAYRKYVQRYGKFRSLQEKVAQNPKVRELLGCAVIHTTVHNHVVPCSDYYDKSNPENNDKVVGFDKRAKQLLQLQKVYSGKLYVHLDGWGNRGYDNLHPDILPPSPRGGGWEELRKLQEMCKSHQILLAFHDQYRDFYYDAQSYNPALTVKDRKGNQEYCEIWAGGPHSFLCSSLSKGYIERNYDQLKNNGVEPDGVYLDVFAVVPPEECYDAGHRMSRKECLVYRGECFEEIRSRGMIVSSEEPVDWAVPYLDLVHHGPHALIPGPGEGPAIGIPVPLFNLVYHDSIVLPWSLEKGAWGIPETQWGFLYGLLNAGVPYLPIEPSEQQLQLVETMARLHERVGMLEMTHHEAVNGDWQQQRAIYADGTVVEVDFTNDSYSIQY